MLVTKYELLSLLDALPMGANIVLPDTIEVERPGEACGQIYKTPRGVITYREYAK